MLKFLGSGSAFNTKLGNNSSFILKNNRLILIDAGCLVFHKLQTMNIFNGLISLDIIITHTHPDHCGSLGEIIFYSYYYTKILPTIYYPNKKHLTDFLNLVGIPDSFYTLIPDFSTKIHNDFFSDYSINFFNSSHVNTIPSYSFTLKNSQSNIYYSGDSNTIPPEIINNLKTGNINLLFQDTCGLDYDNNPHLSINKLTNLIEENLRDKVYCMHIDSYLDIEETYKLGFKVVRNV